MTEAIQKISKEDIQDLALLSSAGDMSCGTMQFLQSTGPS